MQAVHHSSPLVRSTAHAGLSDIPYAAYQALRPSQQMQLWQWVWHACHHDEAAAVRAAAIMGLGYIAASLPVQACHSGVHLYA